MKLNQNHNNQLYLHEYDRGYLPHLDGAELTQFITFRLHTLLDTGISTGILLNPKLASIVRDSLLFYNNRKYYLHAWVVMPNHVHVLVSPNLGELIRKTVGAWKGYTAKLINQELGRTGVVWQREYFDRYIRSERHFVITKSYIEQNPVASGLVRSSLDWKFSSAYQ